MHRLRPLRAPRISRRPTSARRVARPLERRRGAAPTSPPGRPAGDPPRTSSRSTSRVCPPGVGAARRAARARRRARRSVLEPPTTDVGRHPDSRDLPRRHHRLAPPRRSIAPTGRLHRSATSVAQRHLREPRAVDEARLHDGDEVQIGRFRLVLRPRRRTAGGADMADARRTSRSATCWTSCATSSPTSRSRRSASSRARG